MRFKLFLRFIPTFLFALALVSAHAQVAPQAVQGGFPVVAGLGGADFAIDWGPGTRMEGITAWVDVFPWDTPPKFHGFGIEVEGRDLNFNRPYGISKMRQDTGMAGPIYSVTHFKKFRPYGKFLVGIGSIDFPPVGSPPYTHDTFMVFAPGGGFDFRLWQHVWLRGDYEYQIWNYTFDGHSLTPNGASCGLSYDFRQVRTH
ncbi:MAG: outer membrane beta-barrel protein [Terracidiphilus sp.]